MCCQIVGEVNNPIPSHIHPWIRRTQVLDAPQLSPIFSGNRSHPCMRSTSSFGTQFQDKRCILHRWIRQLKIVFVELRPVLKRLLRISSPIILITTFSKQRHFTVETAGSESTSVRVKSSQKWTSCCYKHPMNMQSCVWQTLLL